MLMHTHIDNSWEDAVHQDEILFFFKLISCTFYYCMLLRIQGEENCEKNRGKITDIEKQAQLENKFL